MGERVVIIDSPDEEMDFNSPNTIRLKMTNGRLKEEVLLFTHEVKDEQGESAYFELPSNLQSNGTLQYYGLSAVLAELILSSKIFPIDEIESALHPDLMKHFVQTFLANAGPSQLIVTTHNVQMLDSADLLRKDAVWFTQKRGDGSTELGLHFRAHDGGPQLPNRLAERFGSWASSDEFRLGVHIDDSPIPVEPQKRVRDAFEGGHELRLSLLLLPF